MRLWHVDLLPYLPDLQFKGQLRELVAIMRDWRDKGKTNHLLINKAMEYPKSDFVGYLYKYNSEYIKRYNNGLPDYGIEFLRFSYIEAQTTHIFNGWHNKEYLRVCMANLYEKHHFGDRITDEDWNRLLDGYKTLTGENYVI